MDGHELTGDFKGLHKMTDGERIVDAIKDGDIKGLKEAVNGLNPEDLAQLQVDINKANAALQANGELPVVVIVNDQDGDGRIDVTGTDTDGGLTIAAEGEASLFKKIPKMIIGGSDGGTGGGVGGQVPRR